MLNTNKSVLYLPTIIKPYITDPPLKTSKWHIFTVSVNVPLLHHKQQNKLIEQKKRTDFPITDQLTRKLETYILVLGKELPNTLTLTGSNLQHAIGNRAR